jgi:S1-C subfamily serine protease
MRGAQPATDFQVPSLHTNGITPGGSTDISDAGTDEEPAAHYLSVANNRVYRKVAEGTYRMTQLTVFPRSLARTSGGAAAVFEKEYHCNDKTVRTVASRTYTDRALVTLAAKQMPFPTQALPVSPKTLDTVHYKALCERSSTGSAVLVRDERVMSNAHVVAGCRKLEAVARGQRYPAKVLTEDTRMDLALVEVTGYTSPRVAGLGLRRSLSS